MIEDDDTPNDASGRTRYVRLLQKRIHDVAVELGLNPSQISFAFAQEGISSDGSDRVILFCDPDHTAFMTPEERDQKAQTDAVLDEMMKGEAQQAPQGSVPPPPNLPDLSDEAKQWMEGS